MRRRVLLGFMILMVGVSFSACTAKANVEVQRVEVAGNTATGKIGKSGLVGTQLITEAIEQSGNTGVAGRSSNFRGGKIEQSGSVGVSSGGADSVSSSSNSARQERIKNAE